MAWPSVPYTQLKKKEVNMANKTKHLPHVEVMARKYQANKAILLQECHVSEDAYNLTIFNSAIAWIRANVWDDNDMVDALTNQPEFWAWWVNQWNMREDALIHEYLEYIISEDDWSDLLYPAWVNIHKVDCINLLVKQPDWIQDAYSKIIHQSIKAIRK